MYSQKWNCAASFPFSTFMFLWAIYIFPPSVLLFSAEKQAVQCFCSVRTNWDFAQLLLVFKYWIGRTNPRWWPMYETEREQHRLNMELDLQSLVRLHVHSCTHWLRPRNLPPPPHLGPYTRALLVTGQHRFFTSFAGFWYPAKKTFVFH